MLTRYLHDLPIILCSTVSSYDARHVVMVTGWDSRVSRLWIWTEGKEGHEGSKLTWDYLYSHTP
jgi:hypothetical protein